MTFDEKREKTQKNIQQASHIFVKATDLSTFSLVFGTGSNKVEFLLNQISGLYRRCSLACRSDSIIQKN